MLRRAAALAVLALVPLVPTRSIAQEPEPYQHLVGALHEHSGYSDGWPGSTPKTYFDSARGFGLDFLGSGEHSDNADVPVTFSDGCLSPDAPDCVAYDAPTSLNKWQATLDYARAASDEDFTGFRGFEWTSDRFNHINVYFSEHDTNAKADGGYATMDVFWDWFTKPASEGGGADGLATFNHPGLKNISEIDDESVQNWNDFEYVPAADDRMVGIEVYNDDQDYGTNKGPAGGPGFYVHALDKGWHIGAIGAEDLHGIPGETDDWGGPEWPKTVILAADRSEASLRSAMLARRFYATRYDKGLRLEYSVDGAPMGSRLVRAAETPLTISASVNDPDAIVQVVTSGGAVVGSGAGSVTVNRSASGDERYYFMRVRKDGEWLGYSSPVWVSAEADAPSGEWLAGDLHVHTCYSHDAYCPPDDFNTGPDEFYTLSGTVEERFIEASVRGLDYLAITDHHDDNHPDESGAHSVNDPGFGTHGVIGVPGYENSIHGHAQMLGATKVYPAGDKKAPAINAMADALRADGGIFQANHPADNITAPLDSTCSTSNGMHWQYGFDVPVETVEVWNFTHLLQPPIRSMTPNGDSVKYWECWLDRGARVGATGGSDSHWLSTTAVQGSGNPTTWVFARDRSSDGVVAALREGRTSISFLPPAEGNLQLFLEADADGNGHYESMVGDSVPRGTRMRVRATGVPGGGLVEVRATNGRTLVDRKPLSPGGELEPFVAPDGVTWVRATLLGPDMRDERRATCESQLGGQTSYCRNDIVVMAMTSAIYTAREASLALTAPASGQHTDSIDVSAVLTSDGVALADRDVSFSLLDKKVTATTNSAGEAVATLPVFGDPGDVAVTARFAGDDTYASALASSPFTVLREATVLKYTGDRTGKGETVRVAASLNEDDGPALAGRTVSFAINGATATAATDANGVASTTMSVPDHGRSQDVTVTFPVEQRFDGAQDTATIKWGRA